MTDIEMQDFLPAPRVSPHRPAPIQLPDDPRLATALVLAYVNGADSIDWAPALEALTLRAEALGDVDPRQAIGSLAEQLPVLNSLFLKFVAESVSAQRTEARASFLRLALNAQNAYARTLALVVGLRAQSEGRARVIVETDS